MLGFSKEVYKGVIRKTKLFVVRKPNTGGIKSVVVAAAAYSIVWAGLLRIMKMAT